MSIQLTCPFCKMQLEADDELAGKAITCPNCTKVCVVTDPNRSLESGEKPHLAVTHQQQAIEELSESWKHCPKCNAAAEHGAILCVHCGFNFMTATSLAPGKRRKRERLQRGFIGTVVYFLVCALPFIAVGALGYAGFVWFQDSQASKEIASALETGDLDRATEAFRKLDSVHQWWARVGWSSPYAFGLKQFDARQGKTYLEAKDSQLPLVVDLSVWGSKSGNDRKAWVRFRMMNTYEQPVEVQSRYFLLVGTGNNVAWAESHLRSKGNILLGKGEGIWGALSFGGIVKPPTFLEYNDGRLVSRTPIYINYSMDSFQHDERLDPSPGKAAELFPVRNPWSQQKLKSEEVAKLWQDYVNLREPPAQPASASFEESPPPNSNPAMKTP